MTTNHNSAMLAALNKALATSSDVDGWNFLRTYGQDLRTLIVNGGTETWRCTQRRPDDGGFWTDTKYARTRQEMLILRDQGYECTPVHEPDLKPTPEGAIHADMEAEYDRARVRFRLVLHLMGESDEAIEAAVNKLNGFIVEHPTGSLVLTHGPFHEPAVRPETTFRNLIAMWWQCDDYGSQFNELLWEAKSIEPSLSGMASLEFMGKQVYAPRDVETEVRHALLTASMHQHHEELKND